MKVILLEDVKSVGKKDDVVTVADGYARNVLLPKKLCVEATPKNIKDIQLKKKHEARIQEEEYAKAKAFAEELATKSVTVPIKVGSAGRTFGSVSTKEIAEAAKEQLGLTLDRKKMVLDAPLKELGTAKVPIKIHPKVTATLEVRVIEA